MKVVWLCHFTNASFAKYFCKELEIYKMPFITIMLDLMSNQSEYEIHVIIANEYTNSKQKLNINGIHYYFYPICDENRLEKTNYLFNPENIKLRTQSIIDLIELIKPDLVHVHGTCFIEFSPAVLDIMEMYPVVTSITGFIRNASQKKLNNKIVTWIEESILKKGTYFGTRTTEMELIISQLNPGAKFFRHQYPTPKPLIIKDNHGLIEPIDGIFFARLARDKGIYDFLDAIKCVKVFFPDSKFQILGHGKSGTLENLIEYSTQLGIQDNIQFLGFIKDPQDIYKLAYHAKYCVLPTHHDTVPGTIIESMWMKLPVISYAVGGIPELNSKEKCIDLVQPHNIIDLADRMIHLIKHNTERLILAETAYKYAKTHYHFNDNVSELTDMYHNVLSDYEVV